jgi:putative intracellular protease/amidase
MGMQHRLNGKKIAILTTDGFEQVELTEPKKALEQEGATVEVIAPKSGEVKGRTLTSWPSIKTDLKNAGANWVDKEVVLDGSFITSRKPDDIPAFNRKVIEEIADGKHLKAAS